MAIGRRIAEQGGNVVIAAKSVSENPKIPGTIYSAAEEIEQAGGKALPIVCDIRQESNVAEAMEKTVQTFGHLDIVINNGVLGYVLL